MTDPQAIFQQAMAAHQAGHWDQAEQLYRQVLHHAPGDLAVLHPLAWVRFQRGDIQGGTHAMAQLVAAKPDHAHLRADLAHMLSASGQLEQAVEQFHTALRLDPTRMETHFNLGNALNQLGQHAQAIDSYRAAASLSPSDPEIYLNLGLAYKALHQLSNARQAYEQALRLRPDYADAWVNLGTIYKDEGELPQAETCYQRALQADPRSSRAYNNLGSLRQKQGNLPEAVRYFQQALQLTPDYALAYSNLAKSLEAQGLIHPAWQAYEQALRRVPNDVLAIQSALALPVIVESPEQLELSRQRMERCLTELEGRELNIVDPVESIGTPTFYLAYQGRNDRDLQVRVSRLLRRATPALQYTAPHIGRPRQSQRIRIGFISKHFYNHTIGKLNAGLIARLPRDRFEVVVCDLAGRDDETAQAIRASADAAVRTSRPWIQARTELAGLALDVAFYTDIGMEPLAYYLAHARLAPIQCVTWGHPLTTGISTVDYFISSEHLETANAEQHYSEQLVRLPHLANYYYRPQSAGLSRARPRAGFDAEDHLYVCPQSLFKLHPDNDHVFGEILRRDARALIVMLAGQEPQWTELLRARWQRTLGARAERIRFVPRCPLPEFQQLLADADVLLDPLHFGGGDTSYEGFAVGTPIVTLPGEFLRSRITYALYQAMGMDDCIAQNSEQYVELAVRAATDHAWRHQLRQTILERNAAIYESDAGVLQLADFLTAAIDRH